MNDLANQAVNVNKFIDFHTHILPNIDDGSCSVHQSVDMIRKLALSGVSKIVLTPHFYADRDEPARFIAGRDHSFSELNNELEKHSDLTDVDFILGAEIEYFEGIVGIDAFPGLAFGKNKCILVEMPLGRWTSHMIDDLLHLSNCGYRVVIAHVERYLFDQKKENVNELLKSGITMQSNSSFFTNRLTRGKAMRSLKKGFIHIIGSDCHNMTSRPPDMDLACNMIIKKLGEDMLCQMMKRADELLGGHI